MVNKSNIFAIIRITVYIIITITIIYLTLQNMRITCDWHTKYGLVCPSCGATRATILFFKGYIIKAFKYNPIYISSILPLFIILVLDDIITLIKRFCGKIKSRSLIEI